MYSVDKIQSSSPSKKALLAPTIQPRLVPSDFIGLGKLKNKNPPRFSIYIQRYRQTGGPKLTSKAGPLLLPPWLGTSDRDNCLNKSDDAEHVKDRSWKPDPMLCFSLFYPYSPRTTGELII